MAGRVQNSPERNHSNGEEPKVVCDLKLVKNEHSTAHKKKNDVRSRNGWTTQFARNSLTYVRFVIL